MERSAGSLENPVLGYEYGYDKFSDPIGPHRQKFGLMQPFPWFGTLGAKRNVARAEADAAFERFRAESFRTRFKIKSAYFDYYYAARQLALQRSAFELMKSFEAVIRARYVTGLAMHPDLIKAQLELGQMESMIATMSQMLIPARVRILAQLNLPDTVNLPEPHLLPQVDYVLNRDSLLIAATKLNPNLNEIEKEIAARRAEVSVARKMTMPEFMIGVEYERASVFNDMTGLDEKMNDYMLTAQLTLPIWFGKNRAMRRAAEAKASMIEYMHQEERNELIAMVSMAHAEYESAVREWKLYRDGLLPRARASLEAAFTAYQTGVSDFLMLLDAQRQLLDFEIKMERAQVDAGLKLAELELLTGQEFDFPTKPYKFDEED